MTISYRKFGTLLAVAATALLAACSVGRFAYNNASPVVTFMADDYFDLSGDQEDWVRQRFDRLQAWHRTSELPTYKKDLSDAVARTDRTLTVEDARWVNTTLRNYYHRVVEHALPDVADLLLQLDDVQARRFEERFAKESAKIERETAKGSNPAREEKRTAKIIDQIEGYTGRLSQEQRDLVAARVHFMTDVTALRLADRRQRQELVAELVRSKPAKPQMIAGLKRVLIDTDTWRRPEYIAAMKQRDEQLYELMVALSATWSPDQRSAVQKKLRGYLTDVSSLIAAR
jgi:uncharacterized protein DUF6279